MSKYILSIDQGTTSTRAIIFDKEGKSQFMAQRHLTCSYPHQGWVEIDPIEIWMSVVDAVNNVLIQANLLYKDISAIGISNQRETTIIWDKETGLPVYNAIIWQSKQSMNICDRFNDKKEYIHQKTGLLLNSYFSFSKIRFILEHIKNGQQRAERGELMFGTVDTWLMYKMSQGEIFATDVSNASRTMLLNIHSLSWDKELLDLFNIPEIMLPKIQESSSFFGNASFFDDLPICGVAGDQQASLFGHLCFDIGESKNTYGTGCFMLTNIGHKPIFSQNGLLTTVAWKINGEVTYALEGSVMIGGAAIEWLKDGLGIIKEARESDEKAYLSINKDHLYVVPSFFGLGTPYWDFDVRGAFFGLQRNTNNNDIVRATIESIAYQSKDVIDIMAKESNSPIKVLNVDGGATKSEYLLQFQANILNTEIRLPYCLESTALGVCYLAGLHIGFWNNQSELHACHSYKKIYKPKMSKQVRDAKCFGWKKALEAVKVFKIDD